MEVCSSIGWLVSRYNLSIFGGLLVFRLYILKASIIFLNILIINLILTLLSIDICFFFFLSQYSLLLTFFVLLLGRGNNNSNFMHMAGLKPNGLFQHPHNGTVPLPAWPLLWDTSQLIGTLDGFSVSCLWVLKKQDADMRKHKNLEYSLILHMDIPQHLSLPSIGGGPSLSGFQVVWQFHKENGETVLFSIFSKFEV